MKIRFPDGKVHNSRLFVDVNELGVRFTRCGIANALPFLRDDSPITCARCLYETKKDQEHRAKDRAERRKVLAQALVLSNKDLFARTLAAAVPDGYDGEFSYEAATALDVYRDVLMFRLRHAGFFKTEVRAFNYLKGGKVDPTSGEASD